MTGHPKTMDEIYETHDKLHLALDHIAFKTEEEKAHYVGALNVLCFVLGHEESGSGGEAFQNNLLSLEFQLLEQGVTFRPRAEDQDGG